MDLRPYRASDRDACLAVFDSNTPEFFTAADRKAFEALLEQGERSYFVMDHDGAIVGCGGYQMDAEPTSAELVWGMVRREFQRKGLGRFLLLFRIREITKKGTVSFVHLSSPPHAVPFFESQGFKSTHTSSGRVEMRMKLTVCA